MSTDSSASSESEAEARLEVVSLCRAMLADEMSFFEGAIKVCSLRFRVGVPANDSDIEAFVVIESETDHLPPLITQQHWSTEALHQLQPEFEKTEVWAKVFAPKACENLIERFAKQ